VQRDHDADLPLWRGLVESIARDLRHISTVSAEVYVPGPGRHPIPYLRVQWDQNQLHIKYGGCAQQLRDGEPSIEVDAGEDGLSLASYNLYPGEERIVGFRLRGILREAASARQFPDTTRTWPARQSETASRTHGIAPGQPRGGVACSGMAHPALGGISFRAQAVPAVQGDVRLIVPNRE